MNLAEMSNIVRLQAQTDEVDAPDGLLEFYAESAYKDIQSRVSQWPHKRATYNAVTVAGTPNYAFATFAPTNMEFLLSVTLPDNVLWPISRDEYRELTRDSAPTGTPTLYAVDNDVVWLYPTPAAAVPVQFSGYASFADWPVGSAEPDLPRGFDQTIVYHMMARYYQSQEDLELYQQYMRDYEISMTNQIDRALRDSSSYVRPSVMGSNVPVLSEREWMRRNVEG